MMSAIENEALLRRTFTKMWNTGDLDQIDEVYAADFVAHRQEPASDGRVPTLRTCRAGTPGRIRTCGPRIRRTDARNRPK